MSSPARLLASSSAQELSIGRNSRGGSRTQRSTTTDLQHIMPGPPAVSPPSSANPRPILPSDNGTLLAQLLTGPNLVATATSATLVLTSSDVSNQR